MRKLLTVVIASVVLGTLIFLVMQLYVNAQTKKGALQVTSSPESKVYLGNTYIGQTPLCKCKQSNVLPIGTYMVRLVPQDSSYSEYREKVTITQGVLTVVDRKFDRGSLSSGSTISLIPLLSKSSAELSLLSIPEDAVIFLDDKKMGVTPLQVTTKEDDHILRVDKSGYKEKTLRIRARSAYKLVIQTDLEVDPSVVMGEQASSSAILDTTPTPSATTAANIVILDTPTGFLRVRSDNSVTSQSIGQVSPGEIFPLIDQQDGWYKIRLKNGQTGWISSTYAKKQ